MKFRQKLNWICKEKLRTENHSDGGRNAERYGLSQDCGISLEVEDERRHTRFVTKHTGTGQRERQTINTQEGKWGTGGNTLGSGKTIRQVTHEEGQVT